MIKLTAEEKKLVADGKAIEAMKSIRERIPYTGLREVKDTVLNYKDEQSGKVVCVLVYTTPSNEAWLKDMLRQIPCVQKVKSKGE